MIIYKHLNINMIKLVNFYETYVSRDSTGNLRLQIKKISILVKTNENEKKSYSIGLVITISGLKL